MKDRTTSSIDVCTLCAVAHCLFSKTPEHVMLKIGCQSPILGVLKAAYTPNNCLAFPGGTREKVKWPVIVILNRDVI